MLTISQNLPARPLYSRNEFVVIQICPVILVDASRLYTVVVNLREDHVEKAHFTFKTTGPAGQF